MQSCPSTVHFILRQLLMVLGRRSKCGHEEREVVLLSFETRISKLSGKHFLAEINIKKKL